MPNKFQNFFKDASEKIKTSVRIQVDSIFISLALILIVVLAILVRCSPIFAGPALIDAFDPWVQYNTAEYLASHNLFDYFNWHSDLTWYPEGYDRYVLRPGLVFGSVIAFRILTFFGIPVSLYDVCYYWPAFMGGMTVLIMYFLGKEILDKRTGLLAAFFLAFSPGHMQRTVLGFFDNETIGIFAVLGTFLFFVKAVKSGKSLHAIIGGLFLGLLTLSWGGFQYGLLLLPLTALILILVGKYSTRLLIAYTGTVGTGLLIYMVNPGFRSYNIMSQMELAIPILFMIFLFIFHIFNNVKDSNPKIYDIVWNIVKWGTIPVIIIFGILFWVNPGIIPFGLGSRLSSILNPTIRNDISLVASVAEHKPAPWSSFYFNSLIPVILTSVGIYFAIKRSREEDILMMAFVLTLLYTTGSMIRIILLLAPALALIGGYGLSNILKIFGSLIRKAPTITRRRKRQIRKTIGTTEGIVVYALVGIMFFAQVNHATNVSIKMMSGSSLVTGGSLHDWEETLTFVNANFDQETVVASWWDYGYWLSMIGNVTTVNDNATVNQTRIGATGMAMMQTDELASARMFQRLNAEYVLVFWGYLISGLGGDEGKWQWMVKICNDHSKKYYDFGWVEDNWAETDEVSPMVFDIEEYQNQTNGQYEDNWFQSTLVKLMFYGEPTNLVDAQTNELQNYFAYQLNGDEAQGITARTDAQGNSWLTHIPENGAYDLTCFTPFYKSLNGLVKIYKIDYTALESSFELGEPALYTNGIGNIDIVNTGTRDITVDNLLIGDTNYNFSVENGNAIIPAGEVRNVWLNASEYGENWERGDNYDIKVEVLADKLDGLYSFSESTTNYSVVNIPNYSIEFERDDSIVMINSTTTETDIIMNVTNTGDEILKIEDFAINDQLLNEENVINENSGNFIIRPGQTEEYHLIAQDVMKPGETVKISVYTAENAIESVEMSVNIEDYKLSILPIERDYLAEDSTLESFDYNRKIIPVDGVNTVLYENGTMHLTVKNSGSRVLGLENLYVNEINTPYSLIDGDLEDLIVNPGEERILLFDVSGIQRNDLYNITITATGQNGQTSASDMGYIIPVKDGQALYIVESGYSNVFANETVDVLVKNAGNLQISLDRIEINGTNYNLGDMVILNGNNLLNTHDVVKVRINIADLKINVSDIINIKAFSGLVFYETNLNAILPADHDFEISDSSETKGTADDNELILLLIGTELNELTIDSITINGTTLTTDEFDCTAPLFNISFSLETFVTIQGANFGYADLIVGEIYEVTIVTLQGPSKTYLVEVLST